MEQYIDLIKSVATFVAEFFIGVLIFKQYLEKYLKHTDVANILPKQNKLDLELINKMEYIKERLNADRVHIYEFHNGDKYSNHRPAFKFSCTYEVVKAGSRSLRKDCSQVPTALLPKFIDTLLTEGVIFCNNIDNIKDSMPSTYGFKHAFGIQAFYDVIITDSKDRPIGFIAIQWDDIDRVHVDKTLIDKLKWYTEEHLIKSL